MTLSYIAFEVVENQIVKFVCMEHIDRYYFMFDIKKQVVGVSGDDLSRYNLNNNSYLIGNKSGVVYRVYEITPIFR